MTKIPRNQSEIQTIPSHKIALILIIWTIFLYFITSTTQLEIYFILIFIGFLITRELIDIQTSTQIKHRLDAYIIIFLISYIILISEKILTIITT